MDHQMKKCATRRFAGLAAAVLLSAAFAAPARAVRVGAAARPAPARAQSQVAASMGAFFRSPTLENRTVFLSRLAPLSLADTPALARAIRDAAAPKLQFIASQQPIGQAPDAALAPWQRDMREVLAVLQSPKLQFALDDDLNRSVAREAARHGATLSEARSAALMEDAVARARALQSGTRAAEALDAEFTPVEAPAAGARASGPRLRRAAPRAERAQRIHPDAVPHPRAAPRPAAPPSPFVIRLKAVATTVLALLAGAGLTFAVAAQSPAAAFVLLTAVAAASILGGNLRERRGLAAFGALLAAGLGANAVALLYPALPFAAAAALAFAGAAAFFAATSPRRTLADLRRLPALWRRVVAGALLAGRLSPQVAPGAAAVLALLLPVSAPLLYPAAPLLAYAAGAAVAALASGLVLFLSRRPALRAAGGLALGIAAASLALATTSVLPLGAALIVVATAYARGATPKSFALAAAGVAALAAGLAAVGALAVSFPSVAVAASVLVAVAGSKFLGARALALGAVTGAALVLSYALFAVAPWLLTATVFGTAMPAGALAAGVLGGALVAIAYASRLPQRAAAVFSRGVAKASLLSVALAAVLLGAQLAGAAALPVSALALAAYLLLRAPEIGALKTLALGLALAGVAAGAVYLGAPAVFAAALLWFELFRPAAPVAPAPGNARAVLTNVFGAV